MAHGREILNHPFTLRLRRIHHTCIIVWSCWGFYCDIVSAVRVQFQDMQYPRRTAAASRRITLFQLQSKHSTYSIIHQYSIRAHCRRNSVPNPPRSINSGATSRKQEMQAKKS